MIRVALVGARGYVGFELIQLIDIHPHAQLVAAYSREFVGKKVCEIVDGFSDEALCYSADKLESLLDLDLDVVFLALPNNIAAHYKKQWLQMSRNTCIIDLSSDFRFDNHWIYAQPETCSDKISGQNLIANPGCYATAGQLGLLPLIDNIDGSANIFGVSGYSGAGSKPCDKNNPEKLKGNLMAYQLIDHIHEKEISQVLAQPVHFMPHVAEFFRGIHLTISINLKKSIRLREVAEIYKNTYQKFEFIHVIKETPEVQHVQNTHNVIIGGFAIQDKHLVLCVVIDNLLKGAATQAIQNMNLSLCKQYDLSMNTGIENEK